MFTGALSLSKRTAKRASVRRSVQAYGEACKRTAKRASVRQSVQAYVEGRRSRVAIHEMGPCKKICPYLSMRGKWRPEGRTTGLRTTDWATDRYGGAFPVQKHVGSDWC